MSDVMLLGVLRLPIDMWTDDPLDVMQRHERYKQAANEIERLNARIKDYQDACSQKQEIIDCDKAVISDLQIRVKELEEYEYRYKELCK